MDYILVQAGGQGSRLGRYTDNKPKALLPVGNLPLLFHLFRQFPDRHFVIIADYKKDVLRRYLSCFAEVSWEMVEAFGTGTCAGLREAAACVPPGEPFMLIWCDLLLPEGFPMPEGYAAGGHPTANHLGISGTFPCRWSWDGQFYEVPSTEHGVAGCFWFRDREELVGVPDSGEFVRWLRDSDIPFRPHILHGAEEYGTLGAFAPPPPPQTCRPFNRITVEGDVLVKEPIDAQGEQLALYERRWYEKVAAAGVTCIPRIDSLAPLRMEYIHGGPIFAVDIGMEEKRRLLGEAVRQLKALHSLGTAPADPRSMEEAYFAKTCRRLSKVRGLIPFSKEDRITVNGRSCRNVFFRLCDLQRKLAALSCDAFSPIHGDCTFSNILRREDGSLVLIDPRGYFGFTELYGDERYDWAKLYYSVVGNYDRFNQGRFRLEIGGEGGSRGTSLRHGEVRVEIESNGWEALEGDLFALTGADPDEIRLLHAVIWLSLTTYAWQDLDSICAAFYIGLYSLEDVL